MFNSARVLGKKLAELTDSEKIGKTELSRISGVDRSAIDLYIKEKTKPKVDVLDKLAEALKTTPWELIKPDDDLHKSDLNQTSFIPNDIAKELAQLSEHSRQSIWDIVRATLAGFADMKEQKQVKKK